MPAFVQPVNYLIRFGPEAKQYGDPYTNTVAGVRIGDASIELVGYSVPRRPRWLDRVLGWLGHRPRATRDDHRDIFACLAELGFKRACIRRIRRGGQEVQRWYDLESFDSSAAARSSRAQVGPVRT